MNLALKSRRLIGVVTIAMVAAACAGGDVQSQSDVTSGESASQAADGPSSAAAEDQEEVAWKLATSAPPDNPLHDVLQEFSEEIDAATSSTTEHVQVEFFGAASLYLINEQLDAVKNNEIQLTELVPTFVTGQIPSVSASDLPFLWDDREHLWRALDGEYGQLWASEAEKAGVKVLGFLDYGYLDMFTTAEHEVRTPQDMEGLRLRLPGKYWANWGADNGAEPVDLPGSEALSAMQQGLLDGHITTDQIFIDRKQYEAAPNASIPLDASMYSYMLIANEDAWAALSPDTQAAIAEAAQQVQEELRPLMVERDAEARAEMAELGTVIEIAEEDRAAWLESAQSTWDLYLSDAGDVGQALLDAALAARDD